MIAPSAIITFRSDRDKARWLVERSRSDPMLAGVLQTAAVFAASLGGACPPERAARSIHAWVRDTIRYRGDIGRDGRHREVFADPDLVLARGFDDCDGKARCVAALATAVGSVLCVPLFGRVVPVFDGEDFVHVLAALNWPGQDVPGRHTPDGWVLSDPIVAGAELGQVGSDCARPDGTIPLA